MKNVQECVARVRIVIHQGDRVMRDGLPAMGEVGVVFFGGFRNAVRTPLG